MLGLDGHQLCDFAGWNKPRLSKSDHNAFAMNVLLQLPPLISQLTDLLEQDTDLVRERLTEISEKSEKKSGVKRRWHLISSAVQLSSNQGHYLGGA